MVERCRELMEGYGATMTQVLLGFFSVQSFSCLPLYGPRNIAQLEEAMRYIEIPFKKEDYEICL